MTDTSSNIELTKKIVANSYTLPLSLILTETNNQISNAPVGSVTSKADHPGSFRPMCLAPFVFGGVTLAYALDKNRDSEATRVITECRLRTPRDGLEANLNVLNDDLLDVGRCLYKRKLREFDLSVQSIGHDVRLTSIAIRHPLAVTTTSLLSMEPFNSLLREKHLPTKSLSIQTGSGLMRTLTDNRQIVLFPSMSRKKVSMEHRNDIAHSGFRHFICPYSISQGPSTKLSRTLVEGVLARSFGRSGLESIGVQLTKIAIELNECSNLARTPDQSRSTNLYFNGRTYVVDMMVIQTLLNCQYKLGIRYGHNAITIPYDYNTDTYIISFSPGVLTKPFEGNIIMDSSMANNGCPFKDNPSALSKEAHHIFSTAVCQLPYLGYISPQRISLASAFINQTIAMPSAKDNRLLVPNFGDEPMVIVSKNSGSLKPVDMHKYLGGLNLVTAIANHPDTFEDGIVVCSEAIKDCIITIDEKCYLSIQIGLTIKIGDQITRGNLPRVWLYDDPGTVIRISYSSTLSKYIAIVRRTEPMGPGFKICSRGGHKGVIKCYPRNQMPVVKVGDEILDIDCILGLTTNINRASYATLAEMSELPDDGHTELDLSKVPSGTLGFLGPLNRFRPFMSRGARGPREVKCNYGTMRWLINVNTPSARLRYTTNLPGERVLSTKSEVSLGEMEFTQLWSNGMDAIANELMLRGSGIEIKVCHRCGIILGCVCPGENYNRYLVKVHINRALVNIAVRLYCDSEHLVKLNF